MVPWGCVLSDGNELRNGAAGTDPKDGGVYCKLVDGKALLEPMGQPQVFDSPTFVNRILDMYML